MTIYTLFLYIGIIAFILTLSLGILVAKRQKYAKLRPTLWFIQYFVGSLLVFSGLVKVVDPLGTAYKMVDYFTLLLPILKFMKPFALSFSLVMIVFEVVLGLNLILGHGKRSTTVLTFLMMLFFTFLTGYNYMTGFIPDGVSFFDFADWSNFKETNIKVTDCGCFGDFLKLLPIQTFLKDVLLTAFSVYLFIKTDQLKSVVSGDRATLRWVCTMAFTAITVVGCFMNFYFGLPWIDFRPFSEGTNIVVAREECALDRVEKLITYTYKNRETGKEEVVTSKELMNKSYLWEKKGQDGQPVWQLDTNLTTEKTIREGCNSKITEMNHSKQHAFATNGYAFLVVASDLTQSSKAGFKKIAAIANAASEDDIETHAYYYYIEDQEKDGSDEDDLDKFRHELSLAFDFTQSDEKLVKTIIRSNPGLLLLHNGTIIKKWHHRALEDYKTIKEKYIHPLESSLELAIKVESYEPGSTEHHFICSVQKVNKGKFEYKELGLTIMDGNDKLLKKLVDETTETGAVNGTIKLKCALNPAIAPKRKALKLNKIPNGIYTQDEQALQILAIEK